MAKYLDENGLSYLWGKIVNKIDEKLSSTSTSVLECEESQIDLILNGETVADDVDTSLEETTEAEIDIIIAS